MVRLKVTNKSYSVPGTAMFQFLNGTIKSLEEALQAKIVELFQFLNGTIKSRQRRVSVYRAISVSIPKWYD